MMAAGSRRRGHIMGRTAWSRTTATCNATACPCARNRRRERVSATGIAQKERPPLSAAFD